MKVINVLGHSFIPSLLNQNSVVIDCGANNGEFSQWLSQHTKAQIHGLEPHPGLFARLPVFPRTQFHEFAVYDQEGTVMLNLGECQRSSLRYQDEASPAPTAVRAISLSQFCKRLQIREVDLIKLDIEGAEIPVLLGLPQGFLTQVKQLTVEFHDFIEKGDIPQIKEVIKRLEEHGFYAVRFSQFTYGDVLFLNTRYIKVSPWDKLSITIFSKYLPGIKRIIQKTMNRLAGSNA